MKKIFPKISLTVILIMVGLIQSCYTTKKVAFQDTEIREFKVPYEITYDSTITEYAIFTIFSNDLLEDFVFENQDIRLYYTFYSQRSAANGQLLFRIENKTDKPLYIDMAHSSFICNGRAKNYTETIDRDNKVIMIPDQSFMDLTDFKAVTEANKEEILNEIYETKNTSFRTKEYDEKSSILVFRNKLNYDFVEVIKTGKVVDNKFWVSKLNVVSEPVFLKMNKQSLSNKYIYKFSQTNTYKATRYRTEQREVEFTNYRNEQKTSVVGYILIILGILVISVAAAL